uniref:Ig-like domain-containing protein n=1 Tax=Chelydra serpentina TaxID=8475 RepID=A0A8C3S412_CHESE
MGNEGLDRAWESQGARHGVWIGGGWCRRAPGLKIYVKLNHNSPRILCVTNRLRNSELIDPVFQWHGPGENSSVKITPTGTLIFRHFKYDLSGIYTCSLVFKPTAEQAEKNYFICFLVLSSSLVTTCLFPTTRLQSKYQKAK